MTITQEPAGAAAPPPLTRKDFVSDQETRWCPGCGDYAILAAVQSLMPEFHRPPHEVVFVSGIGCSSRFPYYMNTYGFHTIHGRAPAIATGLAVSRPDLDVWVVTGDGDGLSIGGNHLIHALRRNVNLKILLFNNQIYGLTKGQYSPTSEVGKVTKSTPFGSVDTPFNPVSVALGAEATFVARTLDVDKQHLSEVLRRAYTHRGTGFVEIYQNCNIFNDNAFLTITSKDTRDDFQIRLEHGKPIRFGANGEKGVVMTHEGHAKVVDVGDGPGQVPESRLIVHDEHEDNPTLAFALSRISSGPSMPTPIGIFRDVERPSYGEEIDRQIATARGTKGEGELAALLRSADTWTVN
ncbi:MAG: 2-oxoacid:ferredoxin oxidoreductase subunit beta [Mycobacteriales bacterium]